MPLPGFSSVGAVGTVARALAGARAGVGQSRSGPTACGSGPPLALLDAHAAPALDICLATLPLADRDGGSEAGILGHLLPALSSPAVAPRLWQLVDRAASAGQRAILVRCLGRAGALALDEHFEQFLAEPSETVAGAAVAALADSLGTAAAERLAQVAAGDSRSVVRTAAGESLAKLGSALALPYLREKLKDPEQYSEACRQLARLHHPEAEAFLVLAARASTVEIDQQFLYLPALAQSGGRPGGPGAAGAARP